MGNAKAVGLLWLVVVEISAFREHSLCTESSTLSLKLSQQRVLVPVRLNGTGPFYFLFDTGADITMVHSKVVAGLRLPGAPGRRIRTFAGAFELPQADLESLEVGTRRADGLRIVWADLEKIFALPSNVDGILGQDFLGRLDYLISYRKRQLRFDEGDSQNALSGTRLRAQRRGGKFYISVRQNGFEARFLLDSGIPYPVVFNAPGQPPRLDIARCTARNSTAESSAGSRTLRSCRIALLELGDFRLKNLPVYLAERLSGERNFEDAILPLALFDAIYFNNAQDFVILNPKW